MPEIAGDQRVAVSKVDEKSYGTGVDGLLGMSFLSRFEVRIGRIHRSQHAASEEIAQRRCV
jgi:hypothetical protein